MRTTHTRTRLWFLIAAATFLLAGGAYAATPEANGTLANDRERGRTIHLREASAVPVLSFVDLGAPGPSAGDHVVTTDGVVRQNGAPAGSMNQVCTMVTPGPNPFASTFDCTGSFDLEGGSITVQGSFTPTAAESSFAVTGGTGEFRAARGEVILATEEDSITIKLV